jgi:hypothetical protein
MRQNPISSNEWLTNSILGWHNFYKRVKSYVPGSGTYHHPELKNENRVEYVDAVHLGGNFVPFWTFFDKFVPNIAGKKV